MHSLILITYNLNSGSSGSSAPRSATYDNVVTISNPTKTGYTFAGWTASSLDTSTAKYGTSSSSVTTSWSSTSTKVTATYFKNLLSVGGASTTLTANWTARSFTVTYDPNGSPGLLTADTDGASYSGNNMTATYDAAAHAYTLVNSSTSDPYATIGSTIANLSPGTYIMHAEIYNTSGTAITSSSIQIFYAVGGSYTESQSFRFSGTSSYQTFTITTAGQTYKIRIDNDCGQTVVVKNFWVMATATVTYGSTYTFPKDPTKTGCTFSGWYTAASGGTQVTSSTKCSTASSHTLYAHWTCAITLNANGGSNSVSSVTQTYNAELYLPNSSEACPYRTGYTFTGWYTAASGGSQITDSTGYSTSAVSGYTDANGNWIRTGDTTLYAHWSLISYTASINPNGGTYSGSTSTTSKSMTYGTGYTISNPTRTGYIFNGWSISGMDSSTHYYGTSSSSYVSANLTTLSGITSTWFKNLRSTSGTVTFVAQWSAIFTTSGSAITGLTDAGALLSSIIIPSSIDGTTITKINDQAFQDCSNLENVTFAGDSAITYIGYGAFDSCTNLKTVILPNSVTDIKSYVFYDCTNLSFVYIPASASLGGSVFYNDGLVTVYFAASSQPSGWGSDWNNNASVYTYWGVSMTNDSSNPWAMDGESFVSTNHASSSSSTFTLTFSKAYTISISYMTSSESSYDKLTIKHGSTTVGTYSGTTQTDYTSLDEITLSAGDTITFTYSKDSSLDKGDDCAWFKWEIV